MGKLEISALPRIAADGVVCGPVLVGAPFTTTQGLHFQALHLLSFHFICTLHWCKHCTQLEVAPNLGKFAITAIRRIAADRVVCVTVLVGALFAPTQVMHFQALHLLRFHLIFTLHWWKNCTQLQVAPNLSKFYISTLCRIAAYGVLCGPVFIGAPFAPTHGLHFEALHLLSFHFICTLHWSKHCILLEVATNLGKFHISAVCRIAGDGVVCGPVLAGAPFAPTQGLHFEALHLLSFHFICTLHWWKDCTRLQVAPNLGKFHISALCRIATG